VSTTSGDITSIKYNSVEYQYSKKYTQIASGLGTATVSYKVSGNYATITIATDTLVSTMAESGATSERLLNMFLRLNITLQLVAKVPCTLVPTLVQSPQLANCVSSLALTRIN
jgi:hypothetical protein